jgi:hypothetical protein
MVRLLVDDLTQMTTLEQALINADITYEVSLDDGRYGIKPPYIIVNGAPLDELRALKWMNER